MIEIDRKIVSYIQKCCDSCGSHEDILTIRASNEEGTCESAICLCRGCAKSLSVALEEAVERLYGDPEKHMEAHSRDE